MHAELIIARYIGDYEGGQASIYGSGDIPPKFLT